MSLKRAFLVVALLSLCAGCSKTLMSARWHEPVKQPDGSWLTAPKSLRVLQRTWGDSSASISASDTEGSWIPTITTTGGQLSAQGLAAVQVGGDIVPEVAERVTAYITGGTPDLMKSVNEAVAKSIGERLDKGELPEPAP